MPVDMTPTGSEPPDGIAPGGRAYAAPTSTQPDIDVRTAQSADTQQLPVTDVRKAGPHYAPGTEPPTNAVGPTPQVMRAFAFVDLCGFTRFVEDRGPDIAVSVLARFQGQLSNTAARRGVRVTKWLGDGAMLVGVDTAPLIATTVEVAARTSSPLLLRAGVAEGGVILFAGDDYLGSAVNIAARLCDVAAPGQVLATDRAATAAPDWVLVGDRREIDLRGTPRQSVRALAIRPGTSLD